MGTFVLYGLLEATCSRLLLLLQVVDPVCVRMRPQFSTLEPLLMF